ncbi:MAG: hypothetical protein ABJM26_03560 [Anderseniella sp.]
MENLEGDVCPYLPDAPVRANRLTAIEPFPLKQKRLIWSTEGRFSASAGLRYASLVVNQTTARAVPCQQTQKIGQTILFWGEGLCASRLCDPPPHRIPHAFAVKFDTNPSDWIITALSSP